MKKGQLIFISFFFLLFSFAFFYFVLPYYDFLYSVLLLFIVFVFVIVFRVYNIYDHIEESKIFAILMIFYFIIFTLTMVFGLNTSHISGVNVHSTVTLESLNGYLYLNKKPFYNETLVIRSVIPEHGLYRYWNTSVYLYSNFKNKTGIYVVNHSSKYPFFVKTANGNIYTSTNNILIKNLISENVPSNSVGIYADDYLLPPGDYRFTVDYYFYLPTECDNNSCFLNFLIYNNKIKNLNLTIFGQIEKVEVSPGLSFKRNGNYVKIYGNNLIGSEVLILFKKPNTNNFNVRHVKNATLLFNKYSSMFNRSTIYFGEALLIFLLILLIVLTFVFYQKYGKELETTVPEHLSYVPDKSKKPWEVNYFYVNDGKSTDINGFIATLLYLKEKGKINFKTKEDSRFMGLLRHKKIIIIKILDKNLNDLDQYEKRVMEFLIENSINDEVNFKELCKKARNSGRLRARIRETIHYKNYSFDVIDKKGYYLVVSTSVLISVISFLIYGYFVLKYHSIYGLIPTMLAVTLGIFGITFCNIVTPTELFGRWKNDEYINKEKWNAFKKFLEEMAMIKKYDEKSINQWKDWLIYGVALGVGKKVLKNLRKFLKELDMLSELDNQDLMNELDLITDTYYSISMSVTELNTVDVLSIANTVIKTGVDGGIFGGIGGTGGGGVGGF